VPTKWTKIFGNTLQTMARQGNRPVGLRRGRRTMMSKSYTDLSIHSLWDMLLAIFHSNLALMFLYCRQRDLILQTEMHCWSTHAYALYFLFICTVRKERTTETAISAICAANTYVSIYKILAISLQGSLPMPVFNITILYPIYASLWSKT
jgi:hypothetical protein